MNDYGRRPQFGLLLTGSDLTPDAGAAVEAAGLDVVAVTDPESGPAAGAGDAWTQLAWVAGRTDRIRLLALNLDAGTRRAAMVARAAASLDLLSGGRLDLSLAAAEADTIERALDVLEGLWDTATLGTLRVPGEVDGAHRGPAPETAIATILTAGTESIGLIGARAGGALVDTTDPGDLRGLNHALDVAAMAAARDPREIRRVLIVSEPLGADQLAALVTESGIDTVLLSAAGADLAAWSETAEAARARIAKIRAAAGTREGAVVPARVRALRHSGIDYDSLPDRLAAIAVEPGHPGYAGVKSTYLYGGNPALVLQPRDAADVSAAVTWASSQGVEVSVRSGGHGFSGRSTNNGGIVIDLQRIDDTVVLDEGTRLVRVGAGARWGDVAQVLAPYGWALSSGDSGTVGVGGLATVGGIGFLSRGQGLTIDRIRAVELVTASGDHVRADADTNPELFFGMRGAGFAFGVVVNFEFEAEVVSEVGMGQFTFDVTADPAGFLAAWGQAVEDSPWDTTSFLTMGGPRQGRLVAHTINIVNSTDSDTILERLQPLADVAPLINQQAMLVPYSAIVAAPPRGPQHGFGSPNSHTGLLPHLEKDFARDAANLIRSGTVNFFQIRSFGGASTQVPAEETAFAHRNAQFSVLAMGNRSNFDPEWEKLRHHFDGMYLNFETNRSIENLEMAYPPATLARLRALKAEWDPGNLFRDNFPITPAVPTTVAAG